MDIPVQDTQGSAAGVWRTQRRGETALGAAWRWARRRAVKWKLRTRSPRFLTHRSGKGACGRRARRSRSSADINGALITHARITDPLWRLLQHCAREAITAPKTSWAPRSPTRTADARPTHRQTVRAHQRARGPQREGIARAAPNHQSEPPGRRRVGEKPTRLRENAWKFRGSKFPPVRETNTVSQGKRLRRCLFLLFGSTESEAVFVSFVWVNSCRKD
jgi:hypothetical protein